MLIGWDRLQSEIFQRLSNREVVERLPGAVFQAKELMQKVVMKTTDPRSSNPGGLCLKIEQLADQSAFPVKTAIETGPILLQDWLEARQHSKREHPVGCYSLVAAHDLGGIPAVSFLQQEEIQVLRTSFWFLPKEFGPKRSSKQGLLIRVSDKQIDSCSELPDSMDK